MSVADTAKPKSENPARRSSDWSRLDAMSEAETHAAALSDPDAIPLSEADMDRMRRTPRARIVRRALGLSQEGFADRYRIPIGTLRDWEQGRCEPDQAARAYLTVIARAPDMVRKALEGGPMDRDPR
jgi:putative transcriptional regulator